MPIRGYFEPRRGSWERVTAGLNWNPAIAVQGAVLEGRMSLQQALVLDRIQVLREREGAGTSMPPQTQVRRPSGGIMG